MSPRNNFQASGGRSAHRASGGRSARRAMRLKPNFDMLPTLKRNFPLCEPMDQAQIEAIDNASMAILEDVGVMFRDPIALQDWKDAGHQI